MKVYEGFCRGSFGDQILCQLVMFIASRERSLKVPAGRGYVLVLRRQLFISHFRYHPFMR